MLNQLPAEMTSGRCVQLHLLRAGAYPALYLIEQVFIQPACDASSF
jgi:hypothetical protein